MDVLVGAIVALASAFVGALASARFQRAAEQRAWLRDTRLRCYAEFADAARKGPGQNQLFRYQVRDLTEGEALDKAVTTHVVESISLITIELERLSGRIQMVGLPLSELADHIFVTCGDVAVWAANAPRIDAETFPQAKLLYHEDVDDFIEKARADISHSR
jgi:hypothetical protein